MTEEPHGADGVVAAGLETRRGAVPHVAGVEDAAGTRRVDRVTVLPHRLFAHLVDRDDQHRGGARALRAALPEQATLSGAEEHLLREWLDRLASEG
ncbi:hypothetical protein [Streptomyces gossypii]|uniref:hypothetical protein n=1 Tax=Streptomyces gossypii TaxID=2883101 RepID=UPI00288352D2|nr:hypothetical protein [Streptomyces gossypii]